MNRWQLAGMGFAVAAAILGAIGLWRSEPLPLSARLGKMAPLDANEDGRISSREWTSAGRAASAMQALDASRNGYLEPAEVDPRRTSDPRD